MLHHIKLTTMVIVASFVVSSLILSQHIVFKLNDIQKNSYVVAGRNASCLNNVYSKIWVISLPQRKHTLGITLYQLQQENIDFTVWEAHSSHNNYSMHLWKQFRDNVDKNGKYNRYNNQGLHLPYFASNHLAYENKNLFFLRQTQLDIIKYSKLANLSKILILEDDLTIADSKWITCFCEFEKYIPNWKVLRLGQFETIPRKLRHALKRNKNIKHFAYYRTRLLSYGAFAISFSFDIFQDIIDVFERYSNLEYPLDSVLNKVFLEFEYKHFFAIDPPIVIPDITHSSIRNMSTSRCKGVETNYIKKRTLSANISNFAMYWNLRYSNNDFSSAINIPPIKNFPMLVQNSPSSNYTKKLF